MAWRCTATSSTAPTSSTSTTSIPNAPKGGTVTFALDRHASTAQSLHHQGHGGGGLALALRDPDHAVRGRAVLRIRPARRDRSRCRRTAPGSPSRCGPEARWHDGKPITVDDVIWSFETLKDEGAPFYRAYYKNVTKVEPAGERRVKFTFEETTNRELPLIIGQLPILPKHYYENVEFDKTTLRAAARQRPLSRSSRSSRGRSIVYERVPGLLGRGPAGQPRPQQLRRAPLRVLPRRQRRARGVQGRRVRLPRREHLEVLGDRLHRPDVRCRLDRQGGDPARARHRHAGLRVQSPPADCSRTRGCAGRWPMPSTSSGPTAPSCTASTTGPRATSRTTELAATGLPSAAELALLEPFRDQLPEEVFTEVYQAPRDRRRGQHPAEPAHRAAAAARGRLERRGRQAGQCRGPAVPLRDPAERAVVRAPSPCRSSRTCERLGHRGHGAHRRSGAVPEPAGRLRFRHDGRELRPEPVARATSSATSGAREAADIRGSRNIVGIKDPVVDHLIDQDHRGADPRGSGDRDPRARPRAAVGPLRDPALAQPDLPGRLLEQVRPAGDQAALRPAAVQLVGRSGQGGGACEQRKAEEGGAKAETTESSERRPMLAYIVRRLLLIVPTLLGIMVINFVVIQSAPGGPVEQLIQQLTEGGAADVTARVSGTGTGDLAAGGRAPGRRRGRDQPLPRRARPRSRVHRARSSACTASTSRCTSASSR